MKNNIYTLALIIFGLFIFSGANSEIHYQLETIFPSYGHDWNFDEGVCSPKIDEENNVIFFNAREQLYYKYTASGYLIDKKVFNDGYIKDPIIIYKNKDLIIIKDNGIAGINKEGGTYNILDEGFFYYGVQFSIIDVKYTGDKLYVMTSDANYVNKLFIINDKKEITKTYEFKAENVESIFPIDPDEIYFSSDTSNQYSDGDRHSRISKLDSVDSEIVVADDILGDVSFIVDEQGLIVTYSFNYDGVVIYNNFGLYSKGGDQIANKVITTSTTTENGNFVFCSKNHIFKKGKTIIASNPMTSTIYKYEYDDVTNKFIINSTWSNTSFFNDIRDIKIINNHIYVVDYHNNKVSIFDKSFNPIDSWSVNQPNSIISSEDYFFISSYLNSEVLKLNSSGRLINRFGKRGGEDGEFKGVYGLAIDGNKLFIADRFKDEIQVYDLSGNFLYSWGEQDVGITQTTHTVPATDPKLITAYNHKIYVPVNYRILEFDLLGNHSNPFFTDTFIDYFHHQSPTDIEFDDLGHIYVSAKKGVISIYNGDGKLVEKIASYGSLPHQLRKPKAIDLDQNRLYIADTGNHRIVVYKKVERPDNSKAIIIAGGTSISDPLWSQIQANANQAFSSLASQGYTKDNIFYLNSNINLDLDNNGFADDVDALPSLTNVHLAITEWASDAENVVIYMIDHGGDQTYQLNKNQIMQASQLKLWLDTLQSIMPGKVTVIYDACSSGTFVSILGNTTYDRTIITSTTDNENASFNDAISFSNLFWSQILNGKSISEAFVLARDSIAAVYNQHPQIDSTGNGVGNEPIDLSNVEQQYIGNSVINNGTAPTIDHVSNTTVADGENTSTITAYDVNDSEGITSVWGVVTPPYADLSQAGTPVQNLPRFNLFQKENSRYEGSFDGFDQPGRYFIAIYAQDQEGNTSFPQLLTIDVESPISRKAIIVAGVDSTKQFTSSVKQQTDYAYSVLTSQGYAPESIEYISAASIGTPNVDRLATLDTLEYAITDWAKNNTADIVLYLVGDLENGQFKINETELISAAQLDTWLDDLQNNINGLMTVIHEGDHSSHLITTLVPPKNKERVVISSSSLAETSHTRVNGNISFSRYFWNQIRQGSNIAHAFLYGQSAMSKFQSPQLNDNGNTISNEKTDRRVARRYTLGSGILLAADEPKLQKVTPNLTLTGEASSTLFVEGIVSTSQIIKVWAVITPPEYNPVLNQTASPHEIDLVEGGSNRWEIAHGGFSQSSGSYRIAYYAMDSNQRISQPSISYVYQTTGADAYEGDNNFASAKTIQTTTTTPQLHNFHTQSDIDFIRFEVETSAGQYTIKVEAKIGTSVTEADPALEIYDSNQTLIQTKIDRTGSGELELEYFTPTEGGIYYLKISPASTNISQWPDQTGYTVRIFPTTAPQQVSIKGTVTNEDGGPIEGATVKTSSNAYQTTDSSGKYIFQEKAGDYDLIVEAPGYLKEVIPLSTEPEQVIIHDFTLEIDEESIPGISIPSIQPLALLSTTTSNGDIDAVMYRLKILIPDGGADMRSITLNTLGSGNEKNDISKVKLFIDVNKNGVVDFGNTEPAANDVLIAEGRFLQDNGQLKLEPTTARHFEKGTINLLVTYDFK